MTGAAVLAGVQLQPERARPDAVVAQAAAVRPGGPDRPLQVEPTGDPAFAHRSRVFGLVQPGAPGEVLFAPARKRRPAGPESVRPAAVRAERRLALAPGAEVWLTEPLAAPPPGEVVKGMRVAPERLPELFRRAQERLGALHDRARMFELWFDDQGRITRMRHYFLP